MRAAMGEQELLALVEEFEALLNSDTRWTDQKRVDWRAVWALKKEIDAGFASTYFEDVRDKKRALSRWSEMRREARAKSDKQKEDFYYRSKVHYDEIICVIRLANTGDF